MDVEIMVESLPMLGVCNLCLTEGIVESMFVMQTNDGLEENYAQMLLKCFSIDVSTLDLGDIKRVLCNPCALRLRNAAAFRAQAETALSTLQSESALRVIESHKTEGLDDDDDDLKSEGRAASSADDEDDMVLKDIIIKREPTEEVQTKKMRKKLKVTTKHDIKATEQMIQVGLFPFKIKKNKAFTCCICPETSTNLDDIKTHVTQHNKTNIHLAFKKMIYSNSQRFFKTGTVLRCKICTTDLNKYEDLKSHVENCTRISKCWNNLPFKLEKDQLDCPVCKKTFLNYVRLNTHMNVHFPNFICESCGKAFASKARLRGHMRTHEVGQFPCRYCPAVFDRVTKRENHVSKEHKAGVRYACKRCNISLASFYARQKHLAEIHNEELKRYKCKACPQSYITPGHLSSHVRRDHLNERNHKCDKCDLAFYTKNALKMHMIKHDGERIHSCNICQKSYQRKKTLREHMRIHNNDKRFVCPTCGRAFTQKCTLKGHMKVHDRSVDDRILPLNSI